VATTLEAIKPIELFNQRDTSIRNHLHQEAVAFLVCQKNGNFTCFIQFTDAEQALVMRSHSYLGSQVPCY